MEIDAKAVKKERLEAAHNHVIGRLTKSVEGDFDVKFDPPALAAVAKLSLHFLQESAIDVEIFAKHAKRVSVQSDDVLLLSRKNPKLEENLKSIQASTKNSKKNSS